LAERDSDPGFWRARLGRRLDSASEEDCMLNAVAIASAQAHMGDHDAALEWLERAANYRSDALVLAAVHPGAATAAQRAAVHPCSATDRAGVTRETAGLKTRLYVRYGLLMVT